MSHSKPIVLGMVALPSRRNCCTCWA